MKCIIIKYQRFKSCMVSRLLRFRCKRRFKVRVNNVVIDKVYIKKNLLWVKMVKLCCNNVLIVGKFHGMLYYLPVKLYPVPGFQDKVVVKVSGRGEQIVIPNDLIPERF